MLHLVVGPAGTGKTTRLIREIRRTVEAGRRAVYLIPEQYSFEAEKLVYDALGPALNLRVEVLSFTRLCNAIFRRFGGLAGMEVTSTARYLLMSMALDELKDALVVYRKSAVNVSFLEVMLAACSEFKAAGVTPERLEQFAAACKAEDLADKLRELAMIYGAYQSLLEDGYADPEDCLIRACAVLEGNNYFGGTDVYVDGFTAFMAGEYGLLRHILAQADHVWAAMTADSPYDNEHGMGVFSAVKTTIAMLQKQARQLQVPVAAPELLAEPRRFHRPELAHLSRYYLGDGEPYSGKTDAIRLFAAGDLHDEAEHVAASIAALARSGLRYREIAVVARDIAPYLRPMELAFSRYEIPCFVSDPEDIENKSLTGAVLSALEAVRGNYDAQSVLVLGKSPILGLEPTAVAELENYCYTWSIRGAAWLSEFTGNPRGLVEEAREEDMARLAAINATRRALAEPLEKLRSCVRSGIGTLFARGIYDFLGETGAAAHLTAYADTLPQGDRETFLDENAQLWDILMGILDIFGSVLGNRRLPWARLCELFRLAAGSAELATPPRTLDQVIVGTADRIRPGPVRAVFVLGANEGVFPPPALSAGVFSDAERQQMQEAGLELSRPGLQQVMLERYFTYFALTLASERLEVSWLRTDLRGRELLPSLIVEQLKALFPALEEARREDDGRRVMNAETAYSLYSARQREDTAIPATLRAFLEERGEGRSLAVLAQAATKEPHRLAERPVAGKLFGTSLRLSPSRVERFHLCPFSYFVSDGLRLRRRQKVEFSPLESGSVMHHVLHVMVQKYGRKLAELPEAAMQQEISELIDGYIRDRAGDTALTARMQYLYQRMCANIARILARLGREFAQSLFEPEAFELPIVRGGEVEPLELRTPGGATVMVEGVVDRVDVMRTKRGVSYVRVVDYKSGRKDFKLQDILSGLNLQMLLYLVTIGEQGEGRFGKVTPAGVLYMPVRDSFVSASRSADEREVAAERSKNWRMSGLLLEDEEVLRGMEADIAGIFIPAKTKKDGTLDSKSSLATLAELGKLGEEVKAQIAAMGDALLAGRIEARPMNSPDYPACDYCDYRAVCGFEEGDPVREIAKLDRDEVLKLLNGKEG